MEPIHPRFFKYEEFDSPDAPGSGREHMNQDFVLKLDHLRFVCDFPFYITSGYRTPEHNESVGGAEKSKHVLGRAVDTRVTSGYQAAILVNHALKFGFSVGVSRKSGEEGFIHVHDTNEGEIQTIWSY